MDIHDNAERRRELIQALLVFLSSVACWTNGQPIPETDGCPAPMWVQYNIRCYTFIYTSQSNSLSIERAQELCKDIGADIISINSQEENAFLVKTFQAKWKGPTEVLLGMFYDSDDDNLKWFDNSPVTFTNWRRRETMEENMNTCMKMNTLTGGWDSTACDNFAESATLCKKRLHLPTEESKVAQRAEMIGVITAFVLVIPGLLLLLFILQRKQILHFSSERLLGAAHVQPYSDGDLLVDTMESEDCA